MKAMRLLCVPMFLLCCCSGLALAQDAKATVSQVMDRGVTGVGSRSHARGQIRVRPNQR